MLLYLLTACSSVTHSVSSNQINGVGEFVLSVLLFSSLCPCRSAALASTESRLDHTGVSVYHVAATDSLMSVMSIQGNVWLVDTQTDAQSKC